MNIRQLFAALLLVCLPTCALGQPSVLLINSSLADNQFVFARNVASPPTRTQRVLTALKPSLLGLSPIDSIVKANASVTTRFITTDNYGGGGTHTGFPSVSNITIDGDRYADGNTNPVAEAVADGVALDGTYPHIEKCVIKEFWGSGVETKAMHFVRNNHILNCFNGIKITSSDNMITDNVVEGCRDRGLWVTGSAGNTTSMNNHYFGFGIAAAHTFGTSFYRGQGDTYADAPTGFWGESGSNNLTGCFAQHCQLRCIYMTGAANSVNNTYVNVQRQVTTHPTGGIGVEFGADAHRSQFNDGLITMDTYFHGPSQTVTGNPGKAMVISANQCRVRTFIQDADGIDGTIGVHIPTAVQGFEMDIQTSGFHQAAERILDVDSGSVKDLRVVIRGENIDTANPGKYIDIPAGWDGSIQLINTTTGAAATVTEGNAY